MLKSLGVVELFESGDLVEFFPGEAFVEVDEGLVFLSPSGQVGSRGNILVRYRWCDGCFDPRFGYRLPDGLRGDEGRGAGGAG